MFVLNFDALEDRLEIRFERIDSGCSRNYLMFGRSIFLRITLDLPEGLLEEAMYLTDTESKTAVIELALKELIRQTTIADLKKYRGKISLPIDLDTLRSR